jgi:hypothetical protein
MSAEHELLPDELLYRFARPLCGLRSRRLGYYAAATVLGVNMHLYWVGLVAPSGGKGTVRSNGC